MVFLDIGVAEADVDVESTISLGEKLGLANSGAATYRFFEVSRALTFDRKAARVMRLNILAGARHGWQIGILGLAPLVFLFERTADVPVDFDDYFEVFASQLIKRTRSHSGHGSVAWAVFHQRCLAEKIASHQGCKVTPV